MKLPIFGKKEKKEYFLALLLRDEKIKAVIFEEIAGRIIICAQHEEALGVPLNETPFETLLSVTDKVISASEADLSEETTVHKTVFGLKESWTEDGKISKDHLSMLKQLCDELELQPIGFLVFAEAAAHLLQKEEGIPVSAILVEVGKTKLTLSILRAGRVVDTKYQEITTSAATTVDAILQACDVEILPSRIILFDGKKLEPLAQEFIKHKWTKSLPFLHVPQITPLSADFDAQAIIYGTATQMGFAMPIEGIEKKAMPKKIAEETPTEEAVEEKTEQPAADTTTGTAEEFGFVQNTDIAAKSIEQENLSEKEKAPAEAHAKHSHAVAETEQAQEQEETETTNATNETIAPMKNNNVSLIQKLATLQVRMQGFFSRIFPKSPHQSVQTTRSANPLRKKAVIPALLIAGIIVVVGLYTFFLRATVTVTVTPKIVEQNQDIIFSASSSSDFANRVLAASAVDVSETDSLSAPATGSKTTGTKATGTVTLFNNSDSSQTLPQGTTITSSNGLKFALSQPVTVASASGDVFSGTKPGTVDIKVTATDIGQDYNIPANTKFSIGSSVSIAAKNNDPFSGGTKKDITVASKDDEDKLVAALVKNLESKAKNDLARTISSDKSLLSIFTKEDVTKKKFSATIGDEAKSVTLTASVSYQTFSYSKSDLLAFAKSLIGNTSNLTFSDNGISTNLVDVKAKNDHEVSAAIRTQAKLLPKFDMQKLSGQIAGASFQNATQLLSQTAQVTNVDIRLSPNIPFPKLLPRFSNYIVIVIKTNG